MISTPAALSARGFTRVGHLRPVYKLTGVDVFGTCQLARVTFGTQNSRVELGLPEGVFALARYLRIGVVSVWYRPR